MLNEILEHSSDYLSLLSLLDQDQLPPLLLNCTVNVHLDKDWCYDSMSDIDLCFDDHFSETSLSYYTFIPQIYRQTYLIISS